MRVPFPVKVFISYAAVIALGAIPFYIYLLTAFHERFESYRIDEISDRVSLWANELRATPKKDRIEVVKRIAKVETFRVSYIDNRGVVLYDSAADGKSLSRQHESPEFVHAQTGEQNGYDLSIPGVSAAKRFSTLSENYNLYVAARIDDGDHPEVVRAAYPLDRIDALSDRLVAVFRNSQSVGLTVAFLFSLLAAFVYMRPLQRLVRSANALKSGDYDASQKWEGYDEIGDVGNALNDLALQLRQRLATSQASEVLLLQAVELSETPMVLLSAEEIEFVNGAFRDLLNEIDANDAIAKLVSSKKWARAIAEASKTVEPVALDWSQKKIGFPLTMYQLDTAQSDPMTLLTSEKTTHSTLPDPEEITLCLIDDLVQNARKRIVSDTTITAVMDSEVADIRVADNAARGSIALAVLFDSTSASKETLELDGGVFGPFVEVWFRGEVDPSALLVARSLVQPIGGDVRREDENVVVAFRRA